MKYDEVWVQIEKYPKYWVSSYGRIYSDKTHKFMTFTKGTSGYYSVKIEKHTVLVHRIVCDAFIDNPLNLPVVNHMDENKLNNTAENLEWCTQMYNAHYGTAYERKMKNLKRRKVVHFKDGIETLYSSIKEASDATGKTSIQICKSCHKKTYRKEFNEYFRYAENPKKTEYIAPKYKIVIRENVDTGEFVEYRSMREASRLTGVKSYLVPYFCNTNFVDDYNFMWKYK